MPLTIILVECGIELIPKEIRNKPSVKNNFSRQIYASQLLDNALHHTAMKNFKNSEISCYKSSPKQKYQILEMKE